MSQPHEAPASKRHKSVEHDPRSCSFCRAAVLGNDTIKDGLTCTACAVNWHKSCAPLFTRNECPKCKTTLTVFAMPKEETKGK